MPQRVEIRKERGFPQLLGKASQKQLGFPTFPTGPAAGQPKPIQNQIHPNTYKGWLRQ
jgi:hypothetical protein